MKLFDSNKEMLKYISQYPLCNGYCYAQVILYPEKKKEKWHVIDKKLNDKFLLGLNSNQRYRSRNKGMATAMGFRYGKLCILLHTNGKPVWDQADESFTDIRHKQLTIALGDIVKIAIATIDYKATIKFEKRSYQLLKEEIKGVVRFEPYHKHTALLRRIKNLPVVTSQMRRQKEHLFVLYRKMCKKHGRKPVI